GYGRDEEDQAGQAGQRCGYAHSGSLVGMNSERVPATCPADARRARAEGGNDTPGRLIVRRLTNPGTGSIVHAIYALADSCRLRARTCRRLPAVRGRPAGAVCVAAAWIRPDADAPVRAVRRLLGGAGRLPSVRAREDEDVHPAADRRRQARLHRLL